jgi:ribosome-binding protein aMBF1 (putative translation factor)
VGSVERSPPRRTASNRSKNEEHDNVKLQDMRGSDKVIARQLKDPAVRAEWERTAVARAVAVRLVEYRVEHALSQTALARKLGMKQPAVARLEAGEHNPSFDTLARLSSALGIEFHIAVTPAGVAI